MSKKIKIIILSLFVFMMSFQAFAEESIATRIINGTAAADNEIPFQVSLMKDYGSSYSTFCGGTLISDTWVVTAAHCIEAATPDYVIYGTNTIYPLDQNQTVAVANVIVHSGYDSDVNEDNDIALLELASPITTTDAVDYVSTTSELGFITGTMATVSGWGLTVSGDSDSGSDDLLKVKVPVYDQDACVSAYTDSTPVTSNNICAGYEEGGADSCQGDSGGPLFVHHADGSDTLIGVVSFGIGCAEPGYPGVYTKVANYVDWIETNTGVSLNATPVSADSSYGLDDVAASTQYDVDTSAVTSYVDSFSDNDDTIDLSVSVVGGDVETYSMGTSAKNVSVTKQAVAKITLKINPTNSGDDAVVVLDYSQMGLAPDTYDIYMCGIITELCDEISVTVDSTEKWARFYVENNSDYDYHKLYTDTRSAEARALEDKIDVDVYIARTLNSDDLLDAVTGGGGGGGCSASGEGSAFSFFVLLSLCGAYLLRRKLLSIKK